MKPGLQEYTRKRDFARTKEPAPGRPGSEEVPPGTFVVQQHAARRLHFDFRLAIGGVLKSWAVPKGPSLDPDARRLAIRTEDHPLAYAGFEGTIPAGEYGGGAVQLWDRGRFEARGDPEEGMRRGRLKLHLEGEKLRGSFDLFQLEKEDEKQWLLRKRADDAARAGHDAVSPDLDYSVATHRSLAEVAADAEAPRRATNRQLWPAARSGPIHPPGEPKHWAPQLAVLVERVPSGRDWAYEVKWDGYRVLAHHTEKGVRLYTRRGHDWTERFGSLADSLSHLGGRGWVLDGEVVVLDEQGRSDFGALQRALKKKNPPGLHYLVFDLLAWAGEDLRSLPLRARKDRLREWLEGAGPSPKVRFSEHFSRGGARLLSTACEHGLEGIVAKRLDAPYAGRRDPSWQKIKCIRRQEFAVVGFTPPKGSRRGFGALLLATKDNGRWHYRGKVGTGFDARRIQSVSARLGPLRQPDPPALEPSPEEVAVRWVRPVLTAEVRYAELTADGRVRHAVFEGLREDKPAEEAVLETPAGPAPRKGRRAGSTASDPVSYAGVTVSNPDRVIDPATGTTKATLAAYYAEIAPLALPFLADRPLSLVRCPQGIRRACFFQKHFNEAVPPHTHTVELEEKAGRGAYSYVTSAAGLVALAQYGTVELHGWGARIDQPDTPDQLVFDLDPDESVAWESVLGAALLMRDLLADIGLKSFLKATGGKGLHVCVPLVRRAPWTEARPFAKRAAEALVQCNPRQLLAKSNKRARRGKIFVDYLRNGSGATAVLPYSVRARPGLPIAFPLDWEALPRQRPEWKLVDAPALLAARGADPWADYRHTRQSLTQARLRAFG